MPYICCSEAAHECSLVSTMERATGARARMAVNGMHFPSRRGSFHKRKMHRVFQVSMKIIEKEGRCIVPARSAKWNTVHTVRSEFFLWEFSSLYYGAVKSRTSKSSSQRVERRRRVIMQERTNGPVSVSLDFNFRVPAQLCEPMYLDGSAHGAHV